VQIHENLPKKEKSKSRVNTQGSASIKLLIATKGWGSASNKLLIATKG
jgi:hypothetical protein